MSNGDPPESDGTEGIFRAFWNQDAYEEDREAMRKLWEQQTTQLFPKRHVVYLKSGEPVLANTPEITNAPLPNAKELNWGHYISHADALIAEAVADAGWWLPYLEAQR